MASEHTTQTAHESVVNEPRMRIDDLKNDFGKHLASVSEQVQLYLTAQADRVKAVLRSVFLYGLLGIVALIAGLTLVVVSSALLCLGLADLIGVLLGGRQWAGDIIVGVVLLGAICAGGLLVINSVIKSARRQVIAKYEQQKLRGVL